MFCLLVLCKYVVWRSWRVIMTIKYEIKHSNVRLHFMTHHHFMDSFAFFQLNGFKIYFLWFYLLLFDTFLYHWFMAQAQWQNSGTTIILFLITFWWRAKDITAMMRSIEISMNIAMWQNWRSSMTIPPHTTRRTITSVEFRKRHNLAKNHSWSDPVLSF